MLRKLVTPSSSFPPFAYSLCVVTYAVLILMSFALQSQAQTVKTLYPFTGADNGNSAFPGWVTLTQGRNGSLYGTTVGESNGSIFDVTTRGMLTNLFDFDGTDGGLTYAGVTLASDGNYYGVTFNGGNGFSGVFFQLTPAGTYTVLNNFSGNNGGQRRNLPNGSTGRGTRRKSLRNYPRY